MKIFVTGGSGTIGRAIAERSTVDDGFFMTCYSRSEYLQAQMKQDCPWVSFVLGDVRDYDRMELAMRGHDVVIHAAAMKMIPECEQHPGECWKTNVMGSDNVVRACINTGIKSCVGLSTDKACQPVTTYGSSKLLMERIFQSALDTTKFTLVRYGNVLASRGSVIPLWRKQAALGQPLTITNMDMTRFWMTPETAVDCIMKALELPHGSIYVPKMKSINIRFMAQIIALGSELVETGLRSMERLHEYLVSTDELATEHENHFIISPDGEMGHEYTSFNAERLTSQEFRIML